MGINTGQTQCGVIVLVFLNLDDCGRQKLTTLVNKLKQEIQRDLYTAAGKFEWYLLAIPKNSTICSRCKQMPAVQAGHILAFLRRAKAIATKAKE